MIGIDTNVLVRFFTNDNATQASKARHLIVDTLTPTHQGHVCLVVLAELVWVLSVRYEFEAGDISAALATLLADASIVVQERSAAWAALDLYRSGGVDYADALIAALDRKHGATTTLTFDKKAARSVGMQLLD